MTRHLLLTLLLLIPEGAMSQVVWFSDDFRSAPLRSEWFVADDPWMIRDSMLHINTRSYDILLASRCYTYATKPYSFEVTLRGIRAGVFFSLDDPKQKFLSHMVRFDEKSILAGYFDGAGVYTATSVYDIPKLPTSWTTLRIDVNPKGRFYAIYVDGDFIGSDTNLVFSSGYIGLQASDGISEFKSVKVTGPSSPQPPGLPQLGSELSFQHVSFVEARDHGLDIYAPELHRLIHIDADGRWEKATTPDVVPSLRTSESIPPSTYSIENKHIIVRNSNGAVVDSLTEYLVSPACVAVFHKTLLVADPGARMVFQYSSTGKLVRSYDAAVIGGFKAPKGLTSYGRHQFVVADYDRLVFLDDRSTQAPVIALYATGTSCQISWRTTTSLSGWLEYGADGKPWNRVSSARSSSATEKKVELPSLTPQTRYSFRYGPSLKTIPRSASASKIFRFATAPGDPLSMEYTRLPILCMVYRTISYRDKYPFLRFPKIPDGRTLSDDDLAYLRSATEFNRDFYFRNSGCRLVLDFDFFVVEDTLWLREVGDSDPYWLSPNDRVARDYEHAARTFGKRPEDYAGLICPYAWVNYPSRRTSAMRDPSPGDSIRIRQAVGGGTYGVPAPWRYGKNAGYTSNPFQDRFSRQDWLTTHEFHHQIDALMDVSGFPEYYHADQPWKMPGRFGEDFDFNAHIMRNASPKSWLTLRFGTLARTRDADHDGVPDDDPSLPFDEKRLGGNPSLKDTDGDSVTDLAEVMMGTSRGSELHNADTDGDGIPDGSDPEPLYPVDPVVHRISRLADLDSQPFGSIHNASVLADFHLAWTDSALYLSTVSSVPVNLLLQIDADNDGWFHGFDNIQIRVLHTRDSASVADYYVRDCSSWVDPPRDRRDILRKSELTVSHEPTAGNPATTPAPYRLVLRIPRNDQHGLRLEVGHTFAIRIGVQTTTDLWVWDELFERNYMMSVILK
jgi:hypothetical protein